jgi:hypothetical protein
MQAAWVLKIYSHTSLQDLELSGLTVVHFSQMLQIITEYSKLKVYVRWVLCHYVMARAGVADGGMAPAVEDSCEYTE